MVHLCEFYSNSVHGSSLFMILGSPISAENILVMYAVCTCLYSAVQALNNAIVQEPAIWYIHVLNRYVLSKDG